MRYKNDTYVRTYIHMGVLNNIIPIASCLLTHRLINKVIPILKRVALSNVGSYVTHICLMLLGTNQAIIRQYLNYYCWQKCVLNHWLSHVCPYKLKISKLHLSKYFIMHINIIFIT